MVGILNPIGNGACWISTLKGKVDVDSAALVFLAANFSSLALNSLISLSIREMIRRFSLLLEVPKLRLASRWVLISSPLLQPSRSKTLHDVMRASSVSSLSRDLMSASGLVVQPKVVLF